VKINKDSFKEKVPIVQIDASLNKYKDVILFPESLAKANEMLRTVGLPKDKSKRHPIAK
jgi:hypothetical protein